MAAVKFTPEQFRASLPRRPYCTDDFATGLRIRARDHAAGRRFVQPNGPTDKLWLVFDLDYNGAAVAWQDANLPAPTWTAQNPANGHAHVAWGLDVPVHINGRVEPIRYAAAVEAAYSHALRADAGYSGLMAKNPLHSAWRVTWGPAQLYGLEDLAEWVDLKAPPKREQPSGLGRNVELFDHLRTWAYKAVRGYWRPGGFNAWAEAVLDRAERLNTFVQPLPHAEVRATARSVARWTWRKLTPGGFRDSQAARGSRKGAGKRKAGQAMLAQGATPQAVSAALGAPLRTVYDWKYKLQQAQPEITANPLFSKGPALPVADTISDESPKGPGTTVNADNTQQQRAAFSDSDSLQALNYQGVKYG